MKILIT